MTFGYSFGERTSENLSDVFPDFKLGWIATRTFRNHLEKKTNHLWSARPKCFYRFTRGEKLERINSHYNCLCLAFKVNMDRRDILILSLQEKGRCLLFSALSIPCAINNTRSLFPSLFFGDW